MLFFRLLLRHWDNKELWWTCGCKCKRVHHIKFTWRNNWTTRTLRLRQILHTGWEPPEHVQQSIFSFSTLTCSRKRIDCYTAMRQVWKTQFWSRDQIHIELSYILSYRFLALRCCTQKKISCTLRRRNLEKYGIHRLFWICVWGKVGEGNHAIIVTSLFSKGSVFKMFSIRLTQSLYVFKFLRFEKHFLIASWSVSVMD